MKLPPTAGDRVDPLALARPWVADRGCRLFWPASAYGIVPER